MKKEYDFSNAVRGKFYRPNAKMRIPIQLDAKVQAVLVQIARKKRKDPAAVVSLLVRREAKMVDTD